MPSPFGKQGPWHGEEDKGGNMALGERQPWNIILGDTKDHWRETTKLSNF